MENKHSGIGIASFIISIAAGVIMFFLLVVAGAMEASTPGVIDEESAGAIVLGLFILTVLLAELVALGLGIAGLCQKDRNKLFAVLGTVFSSATVVWWTVFWVIGGNLV